MLLRRIVRHRSPRQAPLREPNIYDVGSPYKQMFDDLRRKDPELYKRNGILPMLKRNSRVKLAPQRWQDNAADGFFDVISTTGDHFLSKCVLLINLEVKDDEAAVGARLAFVLCQEIEAAESWEEAIDDIVSGFEKQQRQKFMYSI